MREYQEQTETLEERYMTEKNKPEQLLTVKETASVLAIAEKTTWKKIYSRQLGSVLIGRSRRVPMSAIQQLIDRGTVPALQ
jgi:excisionase family DNA binding protein